MNDSLTCHRKQRRRQSAWLHWAALMAMVPVLAGCASSGSYLPAAESALPGLLKPTPGRAALVFYAAQEVDPENLTTLIPGGNDLVAHATNVGYTVGTSVVNVYHVLPQSYGFWSRHYTINPDTGNVELTAAAPLSIRTLSGETVERVGLAAGTARIFRVEDGAVDSIREIDRETLLADPDIRGRSVVDSVTGTSAYRDRQLVQRFFNAESVRFRADGGCLYDQVTATWPNARLVASTDECRMQRADLRFDDGTELRVRAASPRIGHLTFYPVQPAGGGQPYLQVWNVVPGSPADRAELASLDRVLAVDGESLPTDPRARVADLPVMLHQLLAAAGDTVVLRVRPRSGAGTTREVELPLDASSGNRLTLIPAAPRSLTYPDGQRYSGPIDLSAAAQTGGDLPLPVPSDGTGELLTSEGGYLGQFRRGQPDGYGYCFDDRGRGDPCQFEAGGRLHAQGAPERSREAIMADTGGLSGRAAIDLLRQRMVGALYEERWQDYLARVVDLRVLEVDTGLESIYYESVALSELGRPVSAFDRLQTYLNLAGDSGAAYADALALYDELQPQATRVRKAREREQADAREQRREFCAVRQRASAPLCGCGEFAASDATGAACAI